MLRRMAEKVSAAILPIFEKGVAVTRREYREWLSQMTDVERRDLRAVKLMLSGKTPTQAAAKVGVTAKTLYHRGLVAKVRAALSDTTKSRSKSG